MSQTNPCSCPVLSPIVDLERICAKKNLKLSQETNNYLLKMTVRKLGASYCQKLVRKMVADGVLMYDADEEFEVESIVEHAKEGDIDYYLIKWRGWGSLHNSWEPADNLSCPGLIESFNANKNALVSTPSNAKESASDIDQLLEQIFKSPLNVTPMKLLNASDNPTRNLSRLQGIVTNASRRRFSHLNHSKLKRNTKANKIMKKDVQMALKAWEKQINSVSTDPAPIFVENKVDLEGPPPDFEYINDYKAAEGVDLCDDPIVGCDCTDCISEQSQCCPDKAGALFPYYRWGRVRVSPGCPIYECNRMCKCGPDCLNRVVQKGRKHKVCIFRAKDGRGWGVKSLQKIKKGSFVMEYLGEVITSEEAEKRGRVYDKEGMTYLFDLDYQDQENAFTVDAGYFGNISHFVNHSCDPNLVVYGVWINNLDPRLPRIAFFAKRDITKGEELTFDYTMNCGGLDNEGETAMELDGEAVVDEAVVASVLPPAEPQPTLNTSTEDSSMLGKTLLDENSDTFLAAPHMSPGLSPHARDDQSFSRRKSSSPSSRHGRIWCLCGAANCKKYIF